MNYLKFFLIGSIPLCYLTLNKIVYSVLTQLQYISYLATCFCFYKTIFRPMLTIMFTTGVTSYQ